MPASNTFYLASKSPRRKEILEQLGFRPVILASNDHTLRNFQGDEVQLPGEAPEDYVVRIAQEKALIAFEKIQHEKRPVLPVLSADTTVIAQGQILGKPDDEKQAKAFLRSLSGSEHEVRTAICVGTNKDNLLTAVSVSKVYFKELTEEEITAYVRLAEPYDKAGGYGIQDSGFVEKISGSFDNVVGLPVEKLGEVLKQFGGLNG